MDSVNRKGELGMRNGEKMRRLGEWEMKGGAEGGSGNAASGP
jgi:hypothetical protein